MKLWNFVFFFSIVLLIYTSINFYIIRRGLDAISPDSPLRNYFLIFTVFFASSFLIGRLLENVSINFLSKALIWIGAFWLGIMIYLFLMILIIDFIRAINHFAGFLPDFIMSNIQRVKTATAITVSVIALVVALFGHLNTRLPVLRKMKITIEKPAGKLKNLRAAVISDLHLGTIIGRDYLSRVVNRINDMNPDIILIPGDIIDEDIKPVLHYNIGEVLIKLKAKYGVYAVTGNHEYIGGVNAAKKYLSEHNIKLLNDEAILIDDSFWLAGREDLSIKQFANKKRKELGDILEPVDKKLPIILLDHQPFKLNVSEENGIDLQLSGHTHHGQLWPLNYITDLVYEVSWGYKKKGNLHVYVSCGVGGWGPPMRTNSRPEIIIFDICFR